MRIHFEVTIDESSLRPRGWPRRLIVAAALAVALVLPGVALAGHLFSDVPNGHTFHGNISNLANAGVTAGCGGDKFCPESTVTRGQMAGFLNRGLGRVAETDGVVARTGTLSGTVGTLTITPGLPGGAMAGATQFVKATFTGTIRFDNVTSCPCTVGAYLTVNGIPVSPSATATTVTTVNTYTPLMSSGVIDVTGSAPLTVNLVVYLLGGGSSATAYTVYHNIIAETIPFGNTGGSTLSSASTPASKTPLSLPAGD